MPAVTAGYRKLMERPPRVALGERVTEELGATAAELSDRARQVQSRSREVVADSRRLRSDAAARRRPGSGEPADGRGARSLGGSGGGYPRPVLRSDARHGGRAGTPDRDGAPKRALLLVDVVNTFRHEDGERLLASMRERAGNLERLVGWARRTGVPLIYANDNWGVWDGDGPALVRQAIEEGLGGELIAPLAPGPGDRFVVKPRYSAFDHTPLELILESLGTRDVLVAGSATEMCVRDTARDALAAGFRVSVVADACATLDRDAERRALDRLAAAGVRVLDAASVLAAPAVGDLPEP
jgi:nicotinamidase-related amidase